MCTDDLRSDIKGILAVDVVQLNWAKPERPGLVLSKLAASDGRCAKKARRRRDQQNYNFLPLYFSKEMWDALVSKDVSPDAKLQAILLHAIRVGLRLPTEPSMKLMCSLWILVSSEPSELNNMDVICKALRHHRVKDDFDKLRKKAGDPVVWVDILPGNPCEFTANFRPLYDVAFGSSPPVPPRITSDVILAFDMTYSCRGGLKQSMNYSIGSSSSGELGVVACAKPAGTAFATVPGSMSLDPAAGFQQIAVGFMQQMYSSQQKMIEMMINRTSGESLGSARTVSLASLHDRVRMPAIVSQPLALPAAAFAEEVSSPPPATAPKKELTDAAVANGDEVADETADLFEILQHRKELAKLDAKGKAAEAKEKADAEKAVAEDTEDDGHTGAPRKTKASSTAKAIRTTDVGPLPISKVGDKARVKAAAKSKAHVKAIAVAPAKGKAHAKAVGPITAVAGAKVGALLVLGCSKCRWAETGCGQCKDPRFTGSRWNLTLGAKAKAVAR